MQENNNYTRPDNTQRKRKFDEGFTPLKKHGNSKKDEQVNNNGLLQERADTKESRPVKKFKGSSIEENKFQGKRVNNQQGKGHLGERNEVAGPRDEPNVGPRKRKGAPVSETDGGSEKRVLRGWKEQQKEGNDLNLRKRSKGKDPLGRDTEDKLDMLIEQYRAKFSGKGKNDSEGEKQGSRRLGRWFQS
jgi:nucleolar protein 4